MNQAIIINIEYIMKARERIVIALTIACLALGTAYGYFLERSIVNAVDLRSTERYISMENSTLNRLSAHYVTLSSGVSLDAALAAGYIEAPVSAFVSVPFSARDTVSASNGPVLSIAGSVDNAF